MTTGEPGRAPPPGQHWAEAAQRLSDAARSGQACAPVRDIIAADDIDAAYGVQNILTEHAVAAGRRIIGRKIGLTARAVQKQLGVDTPDFGVLFADMLVGENLPIPLARVMQPKIEAEIAIVLKHDLDMPDPTQVDLLRAIDLVLPALEIVGCRIRDWDIRIADTIADNASSGLFVIGGPARSVKGIDMAGAAMRLRCNGEVVLTGAGAACLGHPLNAAAWLAAEMVRRGRPLGAGEIVLTGALGPMVPVSAGDRFEAEIEGIGKVSAEFE